MRALFLHPATDMTRNPLLILLNHQRASAGRVRLPFVMECDGSN
jgi:hypothetical protein